jgi:hypothetical protein
MAAGCTGIIWPGDSDPDVIPAMPDDGQKIRLNEGEQPKWNDLHKRYYVWGYRWIKSRRAWSKHRDLQVFQLVNR